MTAKCHIMASDDNDQLGRSDQIRGEEDGEELGGMGRGWCCVAADFKCENNMTAVIKASTDAQTFLQSD